MVCDFVSETFMVRVCDFHRYVSEGSLGRSRRDEIWAFYLVYLVTACGCSCVRLCVVHGDYRSGTSL